MFTNIIYNMDNAEGFKSISDNSIDLTVTSPPYDNLKSYKGLKWDFETVAKELYRVTKDGGVVVWIVNDATVKGSETLTSFKQALYFKELGFNVHDTMIWHKPNAFNFGSNLCYRQSFEYMFVFSKGRPKTINLIHDVPSKTAGKMAKGARKHKDGTRDDVPDFVVKEYKKRDNLWGVNVGGKNHGHPAIFPEELVRDHILSWSNEGDVVLDPFMGSGTTAIACLKTKRNFIGLELEEEYVNIANKRIKNWKLENC